MKSEAHRLISGGTNFILKGGGWYSDLYSRPKSSTAESTKSAPSDAASSSAATSKTEAKPASTSVAAPAGPT
jgi:hypothetical protein